MKKVLIDGRMLRYDYAGIGRYIWNLQAAIAQDRETELDVEVLLDRRSRLSEEPSLPIRRVIAPVRSGIEGVLLFPSIRAMDLVHFPDHGVPSGVKKPSVVTVHDVSFLGHPETHSLQSRRHYAEAVKSLRRADQVIAVSAHVRTLLLNRGLADSERITVVPEASGLRHDVPMGDGLWPAPYAVAVGNFKKLTYTANMFIYFQFPDMKKMSDPKNYFCIIFKKIFSNQKTLEESCLIKCLNSRPA